MKNSKINNFSKISLAFVLSALLILGVGVLSACNDNKTDAKLNVVPVVAGDNVYFTTNKLSDVTITLGEGSTQGTINWVDNTLTIQKGLHDYAWKFTPSDTSKSPVLGTTSLTGYELIDISDITVPDVTRTYTGRSLTASGQFDLEGLEDYNITFMGSYINAGSYTANINIVPKDEYVYLKVGSNAPARIAQKTCNLTINAKELETSMLPQAVSYDFIAADTAPTFNLTFNDKTLVQGTDFNVQIAQYKLSGQGEFTQNSTNPFTQFMPGEFKAKLVGTGNFTGEVDYDFSISKANYSLTLKGNYYVGQLVQDIELETVAGLTSIEWDSEDSEYNTPLNLGVNYRKAIVSGGDYYLDGTINVEIDVDTLSVANEGDLITAINTFGVTNISVEENIELTQDLDIAKDKVLIVKAEKTLTVGAGKTLRIYSADALNVLGNIVYGGEHGNIILGVDNAADLAKGISNNVANKVELLNEIYSEQNIQIFANKDIDCVLDLNGFNIHKTIQIINGLPENDFNVKLSIINSQETGGLITALDAGALEFFTNAKAEINVTGIQLSSNIYAFATNGLYDGAKLTFTNCELTSEDTGAYLSGDCDYTLTGCTINAATGLYIKAGKVNLTQCTITADGIYQQFESLVGEFLPTGDAIVIESNSVYDTDLTVTITDCTLSSVNCLTLHENGTTDGCNTTINVSGTELGTKFESQENAGAQGYYTKNDNVTVLDAE